MCLACWKAEVAHSSSEQGGALFKLQPVYIGVLSRFAWNLNCMAVI